jgi:two-component system, cell cycle sensor histidine kinase and response regulator CckA
MCIIILDNIPGADILEDRSKTKEELIHELSELRLRVAGMEAERKGAEEALRSEKEAFFTILENHPIGVILIGADGKFQYVNPEFTHITGYTLQDVPSGRDWFQKAYPDPAYRKKVIATWKQDMLSGAGGSMDREFTITRSDGKTRDVDLRCTFMKDFTITVLRDITERKQAERALQESEAKYRNVVEDSLVGIYIIQDGLFRFVNKRFCEIFGYTYVEIVDVLHPRDLTYPDDRERIEVVLQKRIDGEIKNIENNFRAVRKDGRVMTVRILGSMILYKGQPAAVGSIIDISRERDLETKLRQAQKMEAIGTLAGGIAHDFNNVLTVITGYSALLQMETFEGDHLRTYTDQILSAATKATRLTQNLLTFSRQQPMVLRPLNINNIIRETEALLKRLISEDITLDIVLTSREIVIMGDVTQIEQILFNLAANARDAMLHGGSLIIETMDITITEDFIEAHGFGNPGQYVLISVSDTGIGMDSTTQDQVFDPFFTTKEVGKGTGLGLSTVYGIVKEHNGYISVYSEPHMGTTFNIYLPAVAGINIEETAPVSEIRRGKETVLIAEDSDSVREIISTILRNYGYTVVEAVDGSDAVEIFSGHREIDLIILDSVMPGKNGREVYEEIKKMKPDIKVLFISGHARDTVLDKGIMDKDFNFISKPVSPGELLQTLREILDK